jgi:histidinol-phosphate aminotransferase
MTMTTTDLLVRCSPVVAGLQPYSPGRPAVSLDLVLDSNEGPPPAGDGLVQPSMRTYPSTGRLEGLIAHRLGVPAESVLVTAGADDGLERALRAVCCPDREVLLTRPSFEMLPRYARLAGAGVRELEWWSGPFPVQAVCDAASERTAAVAVVSPNNPTGAVASAEELDALAAALPSALLLVDHAYVEFASEDLTRTALRHPNALVFRTFSKAWGCAGLRVGYVLGDPRVLAWLRAVGHPYPVSGPSLAAVESLLEAGSGPDEAVIEAIRDRRAALSAALEGLGCEVLPSEGNFVLTRVASALRVRDLLASLGVAVRGFAGRGELASWLRITVPGSDRDLDRLVGVLGAAIAPEALLLDMDGVLADVSRSYRVAIVATAASFGVAVAPGDVVRAKANGHANNDWELTQRLLAEHGVDRPLAEVTERFETLYQGGAGQPGLRTTERPLLTREQLEQLASRLRLGVVTGRPRRDAERFLAEHRLGCFDTLVCMEDAPAKPDPGPVRLALERLGVGRAWMLGDTPDDVCSARAAGVVPVGVVAPADDAAVTAESLRSAGAGLVLERTEQILEVLP